MKHLFRQFFALLLAVFAGLLIGCSAVEPESNELAAANDLPNGLEKAAVLASFIVHGDTHSGADNMNPYVPIVHPLLIQEFTQRNPDYLFHTGDVIDSNSQSFNPYVLDYGPVWSDLIDEIPTYPTLGNHDEPAQFFGFFDHLDDEPQYVVTDETAGCLFIVLDISACGDGTDLGVQEEFLIETFSNPNYDNLPHRFVFFHDPPYTTGFREGCTPAQDWDEMLRENGVDIVFSGHTHAYERFKSPGGQSPAYIVTGGAGGYKHYPGNEVFDNLVYSVYNLNYVQVYVEAGGILHVVVRDPNGEPIEEFPIFD